MSEEDFFAELKAEFLEEAKDLLERSEDFFFKFEKDPSNEEYTHEISRLFHNFKGSGHAVGLSDLATFAHKAEDVIVAVKEKRLEPSEVVIEALIKTNDMLIEAVNSMSDGDDIGDFFTAHQNHLESLLDPNAEVPASPEPSDKHTETTVEQMPKPPEIEAPVKAEGPAAEAATPPVAKKKAKQESFLKVPADRIEYLVNGFSEVAMQISHLGTVAQSLPPEQRLKYLDSFNEIYKSVWNMQQQTLSLKMVRMKSFFQRMEKVAREASKKLDKKIDFTYEGEDQELDKSIVDALVDPLTHMVRNAIDHGVEATEEERRAAGKAPEGRVLLKGFQRSGNFFIQLIDDGKGINAEAIYNKAIEKGVISSGTELSDEEKINLIFSPGFSTKDQASQMSGRGVGMDVVKTMIEGLNGTSQIQTELGQGTTFTIQLPLSLSLFNGTSIRVADETFVVNNSEIQSVLSLSEARVESLESGKQALVLDDELIPLLSLKSMLGLNREEAPGDQVAIITKIQQTTVGVSFHEVFNTENILLKKLDQVSSGVGFFAGGAVTKDGRTSYVLDLSNLVNSHMGVAA